MMMMMMMTKLLFICLVLKVFFSHLCGEKRKEGREKGGKREIVA